MIQSWIIFSYLFSFLSFNQFSFAYCTAFISCAKLLSNFFLIVSSSGYQRPLLLKYCIICLTQGRILYCFTTLLLYFITGNLSIIINVVSVFILGINCCQYCKTLGVLTITIFVLICSP